MDPMSIANMSMSMANSQTMSQIGTSVLSMTLSDSVDIASNTAAMLDALPAPAMEVSVNPSVGSGFDASV